MTKREVLALGATLLLLPMLAVLVITQPSAATWGMLKLVSAVGAGLLAGAFVGEFAIKGPILRGTMSATGGFAVFVLVYLVNPPGYAALGASRLNLPRPAWLPGPQGITSGGGSAGAARQQISSQHAAAAQRLGYADWIHAELTASDEDRVLIVGPGR
jgi:hypothetical protein